MEFLVRSMGVAGPGGPLLFSRLSSRQVLTPARTLADFDFRIEAVQGKRARAGLRGRCRLKPYEVTTRGAELKGWQWQESTVAPGQSVPPHGILRVQLHEPLFGPLNGLLVRCQVPRTGHTVWTSPSLRLQKAPARKSN